MVHIFGENSNYLIIMDLIDLILKFMQNHKLIVNPYMSGYNQWMSRL